MSCRLLTPLRCMRAYALSRSKATAQMWWITYAYDHTKWLKSGFRSKNTHRLVPVKTLHTPTTGIISDSGCDLRAYTACGLSVPASPGFKLGWHKGSCWLLPLMRCCQWWAVAFHQGTTFCQLYKRVDKARQHTKIVALKQNPTAKNKATTSNLCSKLQARLAASVYSQKCCRQLLQEMCRGMPVTVASSE